MENDSTPAPDNNETQIHSPAGDTNSQGADTTTDGNSQQATQDVSTEGTDVRETGKDATTETTETPTPSFDAFEKRRKGGEDEVEEKTTVEKKENVAEDKLGVTTTDKSKAQDLKPLPTDKQTAQARKREELKQLGVPESEYKFYEQMSGEAFSKVKDTIVENSRLKKSLDEISKAKPGDLPANYYENPDAYVLHPDFKKAESSGVMWEGIEGHWIRQLDAIDRGEQWQDITRDKDGNVILKEGKYEPNNEARAAIQRQLRMAQEQIVKSQNTIQNIQSNFKTKYQEDVNFIKGVQEKFFPGYDKPEHPTKKIQDDFVNLLPEAFRNHPIVPAFAMTVANNAIFANQVKVRDGKIAELEAKIKLLEKGKANPTESNFNGSTAQVTTPQVNFSDFERRRQEA